MPVIRNSIAALAGLCLLATPALAGDAAALNILGFSADGKVFAFEEYGIQDGSGFPYANRFYIDTASDSFLPGAPVRARLDSENATIAQAREKAAAEGEKIMPAGALERGFTAAANAITELSADPKKIIALPQPVFPTIDKPVEIRLEEFDMAPARDCAMFEQTKGFRLLRIDPETGAQIAILHEDKRLPESRGCPLGYSLGGLQTDMRNGVMTLMIAMRTGGFEGPDHRWLAVAGKL